jgi:hypothetical protein
VGKIAILRRARGCGQKFIKPKRTWSLDLVDLLIDEEVVKLMSPTLKLPTDSAN